MISKTNLIFILADDMGAWALGAAGNKQEIKMLKPQILTDWLRQVCALITFFVVHLFVAPQELQF